MASEGMYRSPVSVYTDRVGLRHPDPARVYPEGDPRGSYLLVAAGCEMLEELAKRYGLPKSLVRSAPKPPPDPAAALAPPPEPVVAASAPEGASSDHEEKAKKPAADKAIHSAEDK